MIIINASECFPGVEIKGGVCYFLWNKDNMKLYDITSCEDGKIVSKMERPLLEQGLDAFIRYNDMVTIIRKVLSKKDQSFSSMLVQANLLDLETFLETFYLLILIIPLKSMQIKNRDLLVEIK